MFDADSLSSGKLISRTFKSNLQKFRILRIHLDVFYVVFNYPHSVIQFSHKH